MPNSLERFSHPRYLIRRKFFKLLGEAFHVYNDAGEVVLYSKMKAFKLKEDIRLYTDESMSEEVLVISARSVIDFSAAYDVVDPADGERVGTLKRRGMKSFLRDEWVVMDEHEQEIATIREDSMLHALVRRFVEVAALLMPQKYHAEMGGATVCTFRQLFNPIIHKLEVDFSADPEAKLDRRLGLAAGVLLSAIEGRQE